MYEPKDKRSKNETEWEKRRRKEETIAEVMRVKKKKVVR